MDERPSPRDGRAWERRFERVLEVLPYALLAGSTIPSLIQPHQTWRDRLVIVGLVALAAAWVLFTYTLRPPRWRQRTGAMVVYFAGMLTLAAVLTTRSWFFVAFAVTGLVQAFFLLPTVLAFVGVAATSVVIYTAPAGLPEPTVEAVSGWIFIICLQTALTGFFSFMGVRLMEEDKHRRELLARLEAALEENAGLHAQLLTQAREAGILDERQRMAREIHDTLAQGLTGIVTQLEATERTGGRPEQWRRHLDQARTLARDSLTEARRSVQALRPEPLEDASLPNAIADLAERWSATSAVASSFATTGEPRPLLAELEMTLFRVAQEALANVAKHARASKVGLTLSYMDDAVLLDVRDDGAGFVAGDARARDGQGFGLDAMRQRLRRVAGNLEIESAPGEGTAVNARVPAISAEASE
ncbi:MAG TPA: sensor histidine kinase [Actinomycetota bacterium]|nr:sensor histidine kinase [Actinomycetota bacterium]